MLDRLFGDRRQRQELAELKERCAALVTTRDQLAQELAQVKAERDELVCQVDKLKEQLSQAQAKVEETQRKAKRPDAPFRRPQRKHNPKKPGRPAGHAPAGRDKPEQVDEEVQVPLQECPHCGGHDLCDVQDAEPQVVIDVPEPVRPTVRRYHNQSGFCRQCKKRVVISTCGRPQWTPRFRAASMPSRVLVFGEAPAAEDVLASARVVLTVLGCEFGVDEYRIAGD